MKEQLKIFQVGIEPSISLMPVGCSKHQATRMEGSSQLLAGFLCAHLTQLLSGIER